jgi:hypothetical protein
VQVTLGKQNAAIQKALQSGLIDISTAAEMWDTQRRQIYKDFVDQYGGATDQYATEDERIAGQRSAERKKILADLDMRGVDASMVGEELSILDALVGSQTNANVDYMSEMGDIAGMADRDRQWLSGVSTDAEGNLLRHPGVEGAPGRAVLGGGVFGGYEQDLRSTYRDLGLGLELDSYTDEGVRLDQALASNALAERFGMSPGTMMGGMVGGVDLPGMAYGTSERLGAEKFAEGESALNREAQGIDPLTGRPYGFSTETGLTAGQGQEQSNWMANMIAMGYDMGEGGTGQAIGFDPVTGLTAGQQQAGSQFEAGQLASGIDTRQTITRPNYQTGAMETVANPAYGRPMGFDPASGLTAGQQGDQAYRDAMLAADETAATQAQTNFQTQFDAGMMGVDTREFIPGAGKAGAGSAMVRNPTYGMTPTQATDYAMDLIAMTQPDETEIDTFSNLMMILSDGSIINPEMASDVLTQVALMIDQSTGMATKGMTGDNVLFALGQLANTPGEKDSAGNVTYPYRDLFIQVQRLNAGA